MIQLQGQIQTGDRFDLWIPGVNPKAASHGEMSDGMLDVFIFNEPENDYWMSEHRHLQNVYLHGKNATTQPLLIGRLTVANWNSKTATILLDLPGDVTMEPESGAIPVTIQLNRNGKIAR